MTMTPCDTCGEITNCTHRYDDSMRCDACWADALAYGHYHGLHVDDDGEPVIVDGCPTCAGHTPAAYRT